MRKLFIFLLIFCWAQSLWAEGFRYKDQPQSLIDWPNLNPINWLDFDFWKREQRLKEQYPEWMIAFRDKRFREIVGRLLHSG